jgi:delta 1-pyrroline-5-carboxylate dehydrogenase
MTAPRKQGRRYVAGRPRPVLLAFIVAAIPILATFVLQILDEAGVDTPLIVRLILTGTGALVGALATAWAQAQVTPLVDPVDAAGRQLSVDANVRSGRTVPAAQKPPPTSRE